MLVLEDAEDSERIADWIELELSLGEPSFSKSKLGSIIRDATGVEPSEAKESDVWLRLKARSALYLPKFFEVNGDLVTRRDDVDDGRLEYEVCLFFSLYGAPQGSNPKVFERMAAEAIGRHIGGSFFVFGWPALDGIETAIAERVKQVSQLLHERFVERPRDRYKDRGVDIIAWKPFLEPDELSRRSGQLVVLSQCAAGHDWRRKTRELPMGSWIQYLHWAANPIPALAVACIIDEELWHDVAREVEGLVFDRVRLVNYLTSGVQDDDLKNALTTWREERIDEHRG